MKALVAKFIKEADKGLLRVQRMSTLDSPEAKSIACAMTIDFRPFLRSINLDSMMPSDDGPLQSDILTEATEAMEHIRESVTIGYELLDHPDITDRAAGLLEAVLDCLEDLLDFSLPKIIETRRNERQDKKRHAYGIIAHGALCLKNFGAKSTFVVPRGCTIVFLAPPGGFTFVWWTSGKMMEQRLVDDVREGKRYKKMYMVYYHEGSIVRDQAFDSHDPKTESDWIYSGVVKLPLPRRRSVDAIKDHIVERIYTSGMRLSDLVRADRPGIYVVNSCRVTKDDKTWENTVKRNARALGPDQRRRLLACKDRHACKRLSLDSHFGFWWQLNPMAWKALYDPFA